MSLKTELEETCRTIFRDPWTDREGSVVPDDDSVTLGNDAVLLDGTVLYADLAESTSLVDSYSQIFAAEIYKSYLYTAGRIIHSYGGTVTAYDGDRIMAIFIGSSKNSSAAKAALKLNFAVNKIIMPKLKAQYPKTPYLLKQVVGIDTSKLLVAKTGVRGANDLVWVGRAANHAARLTTLPDDFPTYITADVYQQLNEDSKLGNAGEDMWEARKWLWNGSTIYRSNYSWGIG